MYIIMRNKDSDGQLRNTMNGKKYPCTILEVGDNDLDGCPVSHKTIQFIDDIGDAVYYWETFPSNCIEIVEEENIIFDEKQQIQEHNNQIKILQDEINAIRAELSTTFDEWYNCKDDKAKDKLEWKRNKIGSPIYIKVYQINSHKDKIEEIKKNILKSLE